LLTLTPAAARAQGNDRSAPTGGRTALMGNTGIALGEDGASPFMNPATIVRIHDSSVAFSVNFVSFSDEHFSDWHQPGGVDAKNFGNVGLTGTGVWSTNLNALPSTLCLFFTTAGAAVESDLGLTVRQGRQKLAVCFATLESQNTTLAALGFNGMTPAGTTAQVQSIAENFTRAQAGPTYSIALTDRFALGLSLDGVLTNDSFSLDSNGISSAVGGGSLGSTFGASGAGHSFDLAAIVGATYRFDRVTIGLSSQLPAVHVFGGYNGALHQSSAIGATNNESLVNGSGNFEALPPPRIGLGVGFKLPRFILEVDGSFDFGSSTAFSSSLTGTTTTFAATGPTNTPVAATYSMPTHPIGNVAVGGEYFLAPDLSLLGGVSTNLSSLPGLSPAQTLGNFTPERTNWINASFGLGSYGSVGSFLVGAVLGFGWGEGLAINPYVLPNNWAVVDTQSYSALLVLAGSINFKSVKKAMNEVETVVKKGPSKPEAPSSAPTPNPASSPAPGPPSTPAPTSTPGTSSAPPPAWAPTWSTTPSPTPMPITTPTSKDGG
jgi:hypothetical protein